MFEIIVFTVLLFLSGFFSSTETAYFSLHMAKVRMMQQKKLKNSELVLKLKRDPQRLLVTILIGNNIVNLLTASLATVVATDYFASAAVGIATGVTTFFILIFGEIVPKSLAITHAEGISRLVAIPLYGLYILFYPVSSVLMLLSDRLAKLFGGKHSTAAQVTEEEVRVLTRLGVESGEINYREREMIENIFRFDDIEAGEVMTPLYKVELLNGTTPIDQIAYFVSNSSFSRFPVYDDNDTDDIIGVIHVNTIMKVLNSDRRDTLVREHVSEITVVDETIKIERIFRSMKSNQNHLYLVHRENDPKDYIGIITLEDVLEEIVGEIEDESDIVDPVK